MDDRRVANYLFLFFLFLFILFSSLRIDSGDGETMYRVAYAMVTTRLFAIPVEPLTQGIIGPWGQILPVELFEGGDSYGLWGQDGLYYAKYGLGWSLAAAPLCLLGLSIARFLPAFTEGYISKAAIMFLNPLLTAGAITLIFRLGRRFYPPFLAATLGVVYGLGTIACYYAKSAFSEPLVTLLLLVAIYTVYQSEYLVAGIALAGMVLTRQTAILLVLPVLLLAVIRIHREKPASSFKPIICLFLPLVAGQMSIWGYNAYRFGNPFEYGYRGVGWDTPFLLGLYSLLLSPGDGLLIFSPVLILGIIGWFIFINGTASEKEWAWLTLGLVLVYLIPHALYRDWAGGGGWGPRLLLPILPCLILPLGKVINQGQRRLWSRLLLTIVLTISIFIQAMGVSVNWVRHLQRTLNAASSPVEYYFRIHYDWRSSPLLGQIRSLEEAVSILRQPATREVLLRMVNETRQAGMSEQQIVDWQSKAVDQLSFNVPDFWFVYLWFLGVPGNWLLVSFLALAVMLVGAGLKLRTDLGRGQHFPKSEPQIT